MWTGGLAVWASLLGSGSVAAAVGPGRKRAAGAGVDHSNRGRGARRDGRRLLSALLLLLLGLLRSGWQPGTRGVRGGERGEARRAAGKAC